MKNNKGMLFFTIILWASMLTVVKDQYQVQKDDQFISTFHAQQLFSKISKQVHFFFPYKLKIKRETYDVQASISYYTRTILITAPMLTFALNDDELAFIIGHEYGHALHSNSRKSQWNQEYLADIEGVTLMSKAGYDCRKGVEILKRFDDPASNDHPDSISRYLKAKYICNRIRK